MGLPKYVEVCLEQTSHTLEGSFGLLFWLSSRMMDTARKKPAACNGFFRVLNDHMVQPHWYMGAIDLRCFFPHLSIIQSRRHDATRSCIPRCVQNCTFSVFNFARFTTCRFDKKSCINRTNEQWLQTPLKGKVRHLDLDGVSESSSLDAPLLLSQKYMQLQRFCFQEGWIEKSHGGNVGRFSTSTV